MDAFLVLILSHFNQLYLDAIEFLKRDTQDQNLEQDLSR
jgi:hypothetical protein